MPGAYHQDKSARQKAQTWAEQSGTYENSYFKGRNTHAKRKDLKTHAKRESREAKTSTAKLASKMLGRSENKN